MYLLLNICEIGIIQMLINDIKTLVCYQGKNVRFELTPSTRSKSFFEIANTPLSCNLNSFTINSFTDQDAVLHVPA